tara:strand:+ start:236 stop:571 length:336 start_codon:yes stop_codon:yes gene_type:complete
MDITKEIKAYNMTSNNGNVVPNQIIIEDKKSYEYIFQSYGTTIAKIIKSNRLIGKSHFDKFIILDEKYWDYSRTTLKYLNMFLTQYTHHTTNTKEIRKLIKNDVIELSDLN